jgi:chemotaxis protein MotB
MGRKHKHPEHENHERWLVSYADFITLLFATFTALYAIATADLAKANKAQEVTAAAISQGFQDQSLISGIKSIIQGKSPPSANPDPLSKKVGEGPGVLGKYDSLVPKKGTVRSKEPTVQELNQMMDAVNQQLKTLAGATMSVDKAGVRISFDSTLLFDSGSSGLKPNAQKAITLVAQRLTEVSQTHRLIIEGHTDNQPIHSLFYPSNWELSAARACSVVRLLQGRVKNIPSSALSAVGYADTRPKASNATGVGRAKNRRIDIFIEHFAPQTEPEVIKPLAKPLPKPLDKPVIVPKASKPVKPPEHDSKGGPTSSHGKSATDSSASVSTGHAATVKTVIRPDGFVPPRYEPLTPPAKP